MLNVNIRRRGCHLTSVACALAGVLFNAAATASRVLSSLLSLRSLANAGPSFKKVHSGPPHFSLAAGKCD